MAIVDQAGQPISGDGPDDTVVWTRHRIRVMLVLMLVYVFNFLDRQILSILAEDIKHDLGIGDAAMGFLLGTSFAVFYAVFGVPLGRAADLFSRTRLIAGGLVLWSLMTSLSGTARSFTALAIFRMGVGVGEASASPAAYSLLYDYFPKRVRTTVLAIYSGGIFIGAGLGLGIGGIILVEWKQAFPVAASAPFGLAAWQAAFVIVGLPGLLLALWVASLREPVRGASDGIEIARHPHPWRAIGVELLAVIPLGALLLAGRLGGWRGALRNLALAAVIASVSGLLIYQVGDPSQWGVLGYGIYVFASWCHLLTLRDPETFRAIFACRPLVLGSLGFAGCFFLTASALAWLAVFFQRTHGASTSEIGLVLGFSYAVMGFLGVTIGGIMTDRLVTKYGGRWRLIVAAVAVATATLAMAGILLVPSKLAAYALTLPFNFLSAMYVAPGAAHVNSLAPPQHRATASAAYIVCLVFLGTALGPYAVGAVSEALPTYVEAPDLALRTAMLLSLLATIPAVAMLIAATRRKGWPEEEMIPA